MPAIAKIAADHRGQAVLIVSHTGTNRLLLCALLGIDPRRYRDRIVQDLACLNILDYRRPGKVQAVLINDISHYKQL
jgi:probable phosphoglycerate mutase